MDKKYLLIVLLLFFVFFFFFFFKISRWVPLRLHMRAGTAPRSTAGILLP